MNTTDATMAINSIDNAGSTARDCVRSAQIALTQAVSARDSIELASATARACLAMLAGNGSQDAVEALNALDCAISAARYAVKRADTALCRANEVAAEFDTGAIITLGRTAMVACL
jgi:hypothetical protein